MKPILILGIGNILLRDEGAGVRVVEALQELALPEGVEVVDGGTSGADLVDVVAHRRKVIVVDAAEADAEPGTVLRFTGEDLLRQLGDTLSLHEFGLRETLDVARQLKCSPKEVIIFGIKPKLVTVGLELSDVVAAVLPRVIDLVLAEARATAL